MKTLSNSYRPALRYRWLTPFYDPVVRVSTRQATFKEALVRQASPNLGCGTGTLALLAKRAHRGAELFVLDAHPETLKLARARLEMAGIEVQLDQVLASALPYAGESFDPGSLKLIFSSPSLRIQAGSHARSSACPKSGRRVPYR